MDYTMFSFHEFYSKYAMWWNMKYDIRWKYAYNLHDINVIVSQTVAISASI